MTTLELFKLLETRKFRIEMWGMRYDISNLEYSGGEVSFTAHNTHYIHPDEDKEVVFNQISEPRGNLKDIATGWNSETGVDFSLIYLLG